MLPFKVLTWNCRGLVNTETQSALVSLVSHVNPSLVFVSETLAGPRLMEDLRVEMGFSGCICFPKKDGSRGLALFWSLELKVSLRTYSAHHIDVEIGFPGVTGGWRFTGIYGFSRHGDRVQTWDLLRTLAAQVNLPWLIAGDFNEILCAADKSGGPPRNAAMMTRFREALADCNQEDMGFVGSRFTWFNRFTKERLDRGCCTQDWCAIYPYSKVITLPPNRSDHNPIVVEIAAAPVVRVPRLKRFRFENMWMQHGDCAAVIQKGWSIPSIGEPMKQVGLKIGSTGRLLMEWDAGTFRQRKTEMHLLQSKMDMLMKLPYDPIHFEQQKTLQFRYNELLSLDEAYWRQRSRVLWLKEGDRNSAFFHRKASNRRSRNKVVGITDLGGQWHTDPAQVASVFVDYYENIFHSEGSDPAALAAVLAHIHPCIDNDMNSSLLAPYSDEEIKKALFQMHPSKSPRPDGLLDSESNFTHLSLIPKIKEPKTAADFRPIALCNVVYKIASKVLANRLKVLLPSIISPGRLISDNTLVASEVAHFMHKLRHQNEGFFSFKLDISYITPSRGIRQGDPLSPYLFILCVEGLSSLISHAVSQGTLKGLKMSPQAPTIHHLLFADDSFLFGEASVVECSTFKSILNVYERASGQRINLEKSSVVFSRNVHPDTKNSLASIFGERLTKKLISWRTKILSSAGKEILIKALAQVIPTYVMSCYMLPKGLCDDLHHLCAQFFWGGSDSNRKIHWRSWDRMCLSKSEGGLGFKNLHAHNLSLLAKQGWRLITNPNSLLSHLLKARYFPNGSFLDTDMGDFPSYAWRSIMEARTVLQAGLLWQVGNGSSIHVWSDQWIPTVSPHQLCKPAACNIELVSSLIDADTKSWRVDVLQRLFSQEVVDAILCVPLSHRNRSDRLSWKLGNKGKFSSKTAYYVAQEVVMGDVFASSSIGDPFRILWKSLWKAKIPGKVSICIWRACHNVLPTRESLSKKGYTGDMGCLLCRHQVESVGHVLCGCPIAQEILTAPPFSIQVPITHSFIFKEWLLDQSSTLSYENFSKLLMLLWVLWKNRNDKLWNDNAKNASTIVACTVAWYEEFLQANRDTIMVIDKRTKARAHWSPPMSGLLCMNVDGAYVSSLQHGGIGGVMRNEKGEFIAGFAYRVTNVSSAYHAELLAIKSGLELIQALGVSNVAIMSDCSAAVKSVTAEDHDFSTLGIIVEEIQELLGDLLSIGVHHTYRTANHVAHRLAGFGFDSDIHMEWFSQAPECVLDALQILH
ncbi:uncharacterized protein LOC133730534 [Rosa rugosa]|uniref:uncharacterized protein LOC133730534 n=1 Tax=Rosa rugosa TaxID=74645 RepID=UPI002B405020|nr:uncharacterized protein LOC133730534 [Rosa rugosa]